MLKIREEGAGVVSRAFLSRSLRRLGNNGIVRSSEFFVPCSPPVILTDPNEKFTSRHRTLKASVWRQPENARNSTKSAASPVARCEERRLATIERNSARVGISAF